MEEEVKVQQLLRLLECPKQRFVVELEFVELLSNVRYLQHLAQSGLLEDDRLIRYLEYLQYWRRPEYVRYIQHPHALYFLEMLLKPEFRKRMTDPGYVDLVHDNQYWHWRYFRANRARREGELDV